ncbi:hypothetical protein OpiT1DRAFT_01345 [Opitutaceae bacterium TAV1]|nr:hypothetical protein OpiT1DRAFT_01345 [Opitutaceae bacterium TAV1]
MKKITKTKAMLPGALLAALLPACPVPAQTIPEDSPFYHPAAVYGFVAKPPSLDTFYYNDFNRYQADYALTGGSVQSVFYFGSLNGSGNSQTDFNGAAIIGQSRGTFSGQYGGQYDLRRYSGSPHLSNTADQDQTIYVDPGLFPALFPSPNPADYSGFLPSLTAGRNTIEFAALDNSGAAARFSISTKGYSRIKVSFDLALGALYSSAHYRFRASPDNGATWPFQADVYNLSGGHWYNGDAEDNPQPAFDLEDHPEFDDNENFVFEIIPVRNPDGVWENVNGETSPAGGFGFGLYIYIDRFALSGTALPPEESNLLESWREAHFGTTANEGEAADTADPEGDGLPNLLEYALGLDPLHSDSAGSVTIGKTADTGNERLTLSFTRIADPALTYTVEATDDLVSGEWTPVFTSTGGENTAGSYTAEDIDLISDHARRFLRLVVSTEGSTVTGNPFGYITYFSVTGTQLIGVPMVEVSTFAGKIASVSGLTVTVAGESPNISNLLSPNSSYYIEISKDQNGGIYEGTRFDVNTSETIAANNGTIILKLSTENTLEGNPPVALAEANFILRKHILLGDLNTKMPGFFVANDQIALRRDGGTINTFVFNGTSWRQGIAPADSIVLYPGNGLLLARTAAATTEGEFIGAVRCNSFAQPIHLGTQILSEGYPVNSAAEPSDPVSPNRLFTNNSLGTFVDGDTLFAHNPDTDAVVTYTYRVTNNRWAAGIANANALNIFRANKAIYLTTAGNNPDYIQPCPFTP